MIHRTQLACLSILAVVALSGLLASAASATTVRIRTARDAELQELQLEEWAWAAEYNKKFGGGSVVCQNGSQSGAITKNNAKNAQIGVSSATFANGVGGCLAESGAATVVATGLPWTMQLTDKGTATIKGTKKVAFTVTYSALEGAECKYEASKLHGTFNFGGPLSISATNQTFKENKKLSNAACPTSALISQSMNVSSGGEPVEAELVTKK